MLILDKCTCIETVMQACAGVHNIFIDYWKHFILSGCRFNNSLCTMLHIKFLHRTFHGHSCMYKLNVCKSFFLSLIKVLKFSELAFTLLFYYFRWCFTGISSVWMMYMPLFCWFCIFLWVCAVNKTVIASYLSWWNLLFFPFTKVMTVFENTVPGVLPNFV